MVGDLLTSSVSFIDRRRALFNGLCIAAYFARINRKIGPRLFGAVFQPRPQVSKLPVLVAIHVLDKRNSARRTPSHRKGHILRHVCIYNGTIYCSSRLIGFWSIRLRHVFAFIQIIMRANSSRAGVFLVQVHIKMV